MTVKTELDGQVEIGRKTTASGLGIHEIPATGQGGTGFVVKDSGQRKTFAGGMMRDVQDGKLDWWRLYVGPLMRRYIAHITKGASKYPDITPGVPNWTLAAGHEEMHRFQASAARHFAQWMAGDREEDHAAAVVFNLNGYEYCRERLEGSSDSK